MTLRNLPLPVKVLYTCILGTLGTGYFFALTYLFIVNIQPHTVNGQGVVQAVMEKYYGRRDTTALEASLDGGMGDEVTEEEKGKLIRWIHDGATEETFTEVAPIFENSCAVCHNHEDMPGALMTTYSEIAAYTEQDTGVSVKTLVRVSHIHVFGLTFLFTIISGIFVQSEAKSGWRAVLVAIPFFAIWADVGGWWFTHFNPAFAMTIIIGGAIAGMSLGIQIFLSLYEMWLLPGLPAMVAPAAPMAYGVPVPGVVPGAYPVHIPVAPMPPPAVGPAVTPAPQPVPTQEATESPTTPGPPVEAPPTDSNEHVNGKREGI